MDDLFSAQAARMAPLADRMRPRTLDEFIGQEHIVGEGRLDVYKRQTLPYLFSLVMVRVSKVFLAMPVSRDTGPSRLTSAVT